MFMIYVPCEDEEEAKRIGKTLVEEKLAFCVNVIPKINSFYFWEGKREKDEEAVLLVKTNKEYDEVEKRIEELHRYEVPAVLGFEVDRVNEAYRKWSES